MPNATFTEHALAQCAYALGSGAGMKIRLSALKELQDHVRVGFKRVLEKPKDPKDPQDPGPGEPRWKLFDNFILNCTEMVGRLAAANATQRGSVVIEKEDLKPAFNRVSHTNASGVPGEFCPDWP